jgi:putative DNA primase/helicase
VPGPKKFADVNGSCLVEVRSTGQQTVVPPSIHPSGELVVWEAEGEPERIASEDLSDQVSRLAAAALLARHWPSEGSRHETALALAGFLLRGGWNEAESAAFIRAVTMTAGDEEWCGRQDDVRSTAQRLADEHGVTSGGRLKELLGSQVFGQLSDWLGLRAADGRKGGKLHLTELGNARRLVDKHGTDLRFCHPWNKWVVWDGTRWASDNTGDVVRRAKDTVLGIYEEAVREQDEERRKAVCKWAIASESRGRISAMVELAKTEPGIPVGPDKLDADPWLLNCANGTIDLRTGHLREHCREDLCTKRVPVAFDAKATCGRFEAFLDRIMGGNPSLVSFIQRSIGYALTGSTREHTIFIWHGLGANGKSTLVETVLAMLGDYGKTADPTLLLAKKGDGISNNVARLAGARFVSTTETPAGRRLAETLVKQLTGGDTITARFLYAEFFEFNAQFKLFLATNHKPRIRGTDKGIWRRIRLVPFDVTIPDEERDKDLKEKLRGELEGILAWAVRGCLAWQKEGLGDSPEISTATESYRREMDVLGDFLAERCIHKPGIKTAVGVLYESYVTWCQENGEETLKKRQFGVQLGERGFGEHRDARTRYRVGIGLVTDVTYDDADFPNSSHVEQHSEDFQKHASPASHSSPTPAEHEVEIEF